MSLYKQCSDPLNRDAPTIEIDKALHIDRNKL